MAKGLPHSTADLQAQIDALKAEVAALKAEVAALKAGQTSPA